MGRKFLGSIVMAALMAGSGAMDAPAADLQITLPKRSQLTPVQRLNREGVKAIKKHDMQKAESLFLQAYLYDPSDPFTLNNLGYISELEGNLAGAQKFYKLSAEQRSGAEIALSSAADLEGKPMDEAFTGQRAGPERVRGLNLRSVELLREGRNAQAAHLLREALALEPSNAFTLNNLGVANEAMGNIREALKNYRAAASEASSQKVVLALDSSSEGKPISEVAGESAKRLEERIAAVGASKMEAAALMARGVEAANQNNWAAAKSDFLKAYSLDPESGFALNNRGYVAEREGDPETAQFFYDKARVSLDSEARVGAATRQSAEGQSIASVAGTSSGDVGKELSVYSRERRREPGPIQLIPRGPNGSPGPSPSKAEPPNSPTQDSGQPATTPSAPSR